MTNIEEFGTSKYLSATVILYNPLRGKKYRNINRYRRKSFLDYVKKLNPTASHVNFYDSQGNYLERIYL